MRIRDADPEEQVEHPRQDRVADPAVATTASRPCGSCPRTASRGRGRCPVSSASTNAAARSADTCRPRRPSRRTRPARGRCPSGTPPVAATRLGTTMAPCSAATCADASVEPLSTTMTSPERPERGCPPTPCRRPFPPPPPRSGRGSPPRSRAVPSLISKLARTWACDSAVAVVFHRSAGTPS